MSAVFKRDMVKNRNYTLRLIRKKFTAYVYTDSAKLLHFTILGGSAVPSPLMTPLASERPIIIMRSSDLLWSMLIRLGSQAYNKRTNKLKHSKMFSAVLSSL